MTQNTSNVSSSQPSLLSVRFLGRLLLLLGLTACNLQTQPPVTPTSEPPEQLPTLAPSEEIAPLRATPTQFPLPGLPLVSTITLNPPAGQNTAVPNGIPTFDASQADERFEVEAGANETLGIVYEVTIFRGSILMILQGPGGIVWQQTLTTTESSRADVTVPQAGIYELLIDIQNLSGDYQFRLE